MTIDTILGIIGTVLGMIGLVTGYIFYRKSVRIKEPIIAIRNNNLFQNFSSKLKGLEISFNSHTVESLTVTKAVFWNNGSETINKSDIVNEEPLRFDVRQGLKILDVQIIATNNPTNKFSCRISPDQSRATFEFEYIDKDDGVVIQLIHTGIDISDISLYGKIKGVPHIQQKHINEISSAIFQLVTSVIPIPIIISPLRELLRERKEGRTFSVIMLFLFSVIIITASVFNFASEPLQMIDGRDIINLGRLGIAITGTILGIIILTFIGWFWSYTYIPKGLEIY